MFEVDLSHPVWEAEPCKEEFLVTFDSGEESSYCAMGKIAIAAGVLSYKLLDWDGEKDIVSLTKDEVQSIAAINDGYIKEDMKCSREIANLPLKTRHEIAIKKGLEILATKPNVKFINGCIFEFIKEKTNGITV